MRFLSTSRGDMPGVGMSNVREPCRRCGRRSSWFGEKGATERNSEVHLRSRRVCPCSALVKKNDISHGNRTDTVQGVYKYPLSGESGCPESTGLGRCWYMYKTTERPDIPKHYRPLGPGYMDMDTVCHLQTLWGLGNVKHLV